MSFCADELLWVFLWFSAFWKDNSMFCNVPFHIPTRGFICFSRYFSCQQQTWNHTSNNSNCWHLYIIKMSWNRVTSGCFLFVRQNEGTKDLSQRNHTKKQPKSFTNHPQPHISPTQTHVDAETLWYRCAVRWNEMKSWLLLSTQAELNYEILYVAGQQQQQLTVGVQPVPPQSTAICIRVSQRSCWKMLTR